MYDRFLDALMDVSGDCMYVINGGKVYSDDNEFVEEAISDDFPLMDDILYDFNDALFGSRYDFTRQDLLDDDNFDVYLEYRDNLIKSYLEVEAERREYINKPKAELEARKREEFMSFGYEVYHNNELYAVCDFEDSAYTLIKEIMAGEIEWITNILKQPEMVNDEEGGCSLQELYNQWKSRMEDSVYILGLGNKRNVVISTVFQDIEVNGIAWSII